MANLKKLADSPPEVKRDIMRRLWQVLVTFVLIALLLFVSAGSLGWLYAWLYLAVYLSILLAGSLTLPLELIAERGSKKANTEQWDPVLSGFITLSTLGLYVVAGLDFRWRWSPPLATGWHLGAIAVFVLGCALVIWAMIANHFFSTTVRLQFERGHVVCSSGPYRYIRHPGYLGMILYNLATPIFLGSLWAVIPALMIAGLFVARTGLEDRTLLQKLPGYEQYATRTSHRLIPWLW